MPIERDMPMSEYRAHPGVAASDLKAMQRSPAYARARESRETKATLFGTAIHTAVLEPDEIEKRYVIDPESPKGGYPAGWRNAKDYREQVAEIVASGVTPLARDEYEALFVIRGRVHAHEIGKQLHALDGHRECSVFVADEEHSLVRKCRPDWLVPGARMVVDVKSTRNHRAGQFARDCKTFGYHLSAAYYLDTIGEEMPVEHFVFLAINNTAPFEVAAYTLDSDSIEQGRREYQRELARYAECMSRDAWPAGPALIEEIRLPEYAIDYYREEEMQEWR